ncbi:MAG TPA: DUF1761 domain-containing protein [Bacteroidia bacterium]|jgi:hypothetical protein|nr:DUF1761 domain-containing protein [Bacteroidia bacterium]
MTFTWYVPFIAALIPMIMGFIWYNPKTFGKAWMKAADISEDKMKGANMGLIFGLAYFFSLLMAMALVTVTIHQAHIYSVFAGNPDFKTEGSETQLMVKGLMEKCGTNFRTFKHGAFHGTLAGIFTGLPIIGTNALFERKGFKYIAINAGFWIVCMALMGGVICAML